MSTRSGLPSDNNTDAFAAGLNRTIQPIEEYCYGGLQKLFLRVFNTQAVWVSATDEIRALRKALNLAEADKLRYPFAFLRKTSIARSTDRGSIAAHHAYGIRVKSDPKNNQTYLTSLIPVDVTVGVKFVTDDERVVNHMVNSWFMASAAGHLTFDIEYGETDMSIHVVLSESISLPNREANSSSVQEYAVETELRCLMYLSDPVVRKAGVATNLQAGTFMVTEEEAAEANKGKVITPVTSSVWNFQTKTIS